MSSVERITVNPGQCGGRPCVRGMRIRVTDVLDLLATGMTPDEVVAELPDLELPDIEACLLFATGGYYVSLGNPEQVAMLRAHEEIMDQYRDVFAALVKSR